MGFREPIRRSTLSDVNEARDWRIYADFAQVPIRQARKLYAVESLGVELPMTTRQLQPLWTMTSSFAATFWGHL